VWGAKISVLPANRGFPQCTPNFGTPQVEETLRNEALADALAILGQHERGVIVLRYGLYGSEPETLDEIGRRLGVSRERVRQLETVALKQLARLREMESVAS